MKAKSEGFEINIGTKYVCTLGEKKGRIYLPPLGDGVDITNLLMLIVEDYPGVFERYIDNLGAISD